MSKDYRVYLNDIIDAAKKIEKYTKGFKYGDFSRNTMISDAVIRNLEIIGEASRKISPEIRRKNPQIEWKKIMGLRNILIHEYFSVNKRIIWDIVINKVPELKKEIRKIMKNYSLQDNHPR